MPATNAGRNPVFWELEEIQRYTDVCPNPQDSDFTTCRAMRRDGGRCRNPPCTQYERWQIPSLFSEFKDMRECPDTDTFYDKMETFVTYTHCKRWHRPRACEAFDEWKRKRIADRSSSRRHPVPVARQRPPATSNTTSSTTVQPITAATLQLLPSNTTPAIPSSASATSDDGSDFDDSVMESQSVASSTTFMSSLPPTPLRNGTISRFDIEAVAEEESFVEAIVQEEATVKENVVQSVVVVKEDEGQKRPEEVVLQEETPRDTVVISDIQPNRDTELIRDSTPNTSLSITLASREYNSERKHNVIEGLGITSIQRSGSLRDHSPVFQIISSHPTPEKMKEGVVYVLKHTQNSSLFKIGWSSKSAAERLSQPNNCYGINTKILYETKRFIGAPQAERIAQIILRHANIRVLECFKCQGGHREWFAAPKETVLETVMHVEEFLQMPAYTLQDGVYKLSTEAYDRVVKQMCNFSVTRLGELMHGSKETPQEAKAPSNVLVDAMLTPLAQLTDEPAEMTRPNTSNGLSGIQEVNQSSISLASQDTMSRKRLPAGVKLARKVKRLFSMGDSVKTYLLRPRGSKVELNDEAKRPFGSVFVELKDKAREAGSKARYEVREFRKDFKEELRRKGEEQTT